MNKWFGIGRTTKNIELKKTASNKSAVQFTLAVTRNFKNQNGEYESDFVNCITYGQTADNMSQYVKKGDKLAVEGRIQVRNYQSTEGKTAYVTEVVADRVEFLESKKTEEQAEEIKQEVSTSDVFAEFGQQVSIDDNFLD